MTLEECKILHQRMWDYIKEVDVNWKDSFRDSRAERHRIKEDFLKNKVFNDMYLLNNCALCEYARQQSLISDPMICASRIDMICEHCPVVWGTENILDYGFCEGYPRFPIRDKATGKVTLWEDKSMLDWRYSDPTRIRDIPFKDELENLELKGGES